MRGLLIALAVIGCLFAPTAAAQIGVVRVIWDSPPSPLVLSADGTSEALQIPIRVLLSGFACSGTTEISLVLRAKADKNWADAGFVSNSVSVIIPPGEPGLGETEMGPYDPLLHLVWKTRDVPSQANATYVVKALFGSLRSGQCIPDPGAWTLVPDEFQMLTCLPVSAGGPSQENCKPGPEPEFAGRKRLPSPSASGLLAALTGVALTFRALFGRQE